MELVINDDYKIKTDQLNVKLLLSSRDKETGELTGNYTTLGYYYDFKSALKTLVDHKVKSSDLNDLEGVINAIEEVKRDILKVLEENNNVE